MFRSVIRWFVVVVLALDAVAAFLYIGTSLFETSAAVPAAVAEAKPAPAPAPVAVPTPAPAPVQPAPVPHETAAPSTPAETIPGTVNPEAPVAVAKPAPPSAMKAEPPSEAFQRLLRAYENMEPDSAAKAVAGLAAKDHEAVVQMLLGWKPRTSGAILDSLTQINPSLAAELSYEVWKRSGTAAH